MMNEIINLTQHAATDDQIAAGVFEIPTAVRAELQALLTFNSLPDDAEILARAEKITGMAVGYGAKSAMIGGALWLMAPLASALREQGMKPVFAFSVRETE